MTAINRNILILIIGLVLGVSLAIGQGVLAERKPSTQNNNGVLPLETIRIK